MEFFVVVLIWFLFILEGGHERREVDMRRLGDEHSWGA